MTLLEYEKDGLVYKLYKHSVFIENQNIETFGIRINNGESEEFIDDIFPQLSVVKELFLRIVNERLFIHHLKDIVEDFLCSNN